MNRLKFAYYEILSNMIKSQKDTSIKRILLFINDYQYKNKKNIFIAFKQYCEKTKKYKNFILLSECINFMIKTRLTYSLYQIKTCSKRNIYYITRIIEILHKKNFLLQLGIFNHMKKYDKLIISRRNSLNTKRKSNKVITLPTIFLDGDPGGGNKIKRCSIYTTPRSRSSIFFQ